MYTDSWGTSLPLSKSSLQLLVTAIVLLLNYLFFQVTSFSLVISLSRVFLFLFTDWRSTDSTDHHDRVQRQLSVSSDSKLLDDDIREETRVIMRPKKPPRPKSEVFLNKQDPHPRRKRFSAFGVSIYNTIYYQQLFSYILVCMYIVQIYRGQRQTIIQVER